MLLEHFIPIIIIIEQNRTKMNINVTNDIAVDIAIIPKGNKTHKEQYCLYFSFNVFNKGIKQDSYVISLGINVNKDEFENGKVTGRNDMAKLINTHMHKHLTHAETLLLKIGQKEPKTAKEVMSEIKANAKQILTGKATKVVRNKFISRLHQYKYETIMNKYLMHANPCAERKLKYQVPYKLLLEYYENDMPTIDAITSEDLEDFKDWLTQRFKTRANDANKAFKVNTVVSYCCMIAAVFNYAHKIKLITDNHLPKGFSGSFEEGKRDNISANDILLIQGICDATLPIGLLKAKYILLLQSCTGLGIKEMRSIENKHLKYEIFNNVRIDYLQKDRTKTGVEYLVILTENARFVLNKLRELTGNEHHPFNLCSDSKINRHFRKLAEMAGLNKNVAPYQFRHAFAVDYMNNGGNLEDLQKMLGHKDRDSTGIYGKVILTRLALNAALLQAKSTIHQLQPVLPIEQNMLIAM